MLNSSENNRANKALRKSLKGKGILYTEFAGIYGDPREPGESIANYIVNDAIEAGFLTKPDQTSIFGNIAKYEIHITDEHHPYYECLIHAIGYPVKYIELMVGPQSAKLLFYGVEVNRGIAFNMIDGIYNFMETLCVIDSHGWNEEDKEGIPEAMLLDYYVTQFYDWIATH